MPAFGFLGPENMGWLITYVQSLGFKDADKRVKRQKKWKDAAIKAYEAGPEANVKWLHEQIPGGWRNVPNPYPTRAAGLARIAGISVSARKGMLIRNFSCFEQVDCLSDFIFDKTGTITDGQWELIRVIALNPFSENEVLAAAAGLETESDHFIAQAIQRYTENKAEFYRCFYLQHH
jgi:hypothetical protein